MDNRRDTQRTNQIITKGMESSRFDERVNYIERQLHLAKEASAVGWNDQQGEHFRMYHIEPILNNIRELEIGIQSCVDNILRSLEQIKQI